MKEKVIFITGCSSGIGFEAALALKKRGHRVIASCRKTADLEKLQQLGLEAIRLDVNDESMVKEAFNQLMTMTDSHIDILINNAGYGQAGALEDVPREALIQQFNTNVFGLMELTRLIIPLMRKQGHGRIINVSSVLGFISMPFRGAYNASKYAVEGLSDTLRLELKPAGIHVITIEPGPIISRFREHAVDLSLSAIDIEHSAFKHQYHRMLSDFKTNKENSIFTQTPQAVIKKLVAAIESKYPKPKYLVTFPTYLFTILKRFLSVKALDRCLSLISKHELK